MCTKNLNRIPLIQSNMSKQLLFLIILVLSGCSHGSQISGGDYHFPQGSGSRRYTEENGIRRYIEHEHPLSPANAEPTRARPPIIKQIPSKYFYNLRFTNVKYTVKKDRKKYRISDQIVFSIKGTYMPDNLYQQVTICVAEKCKSDDKHHISTDSNSLKHTFFVEKKDYHKNHELIIDLYMDSTKLNTFKSKFIPKNLTNDWQEIKSN